MTNFFLLRTANLFRAAVIAVALGAVWLAASSGVRAADAHPLSAPAAPAIAVDSLRFNFGRVLPGQTVTHRYGVTNVGTATLHLREVAPSCGCTLASAAKTELAPGEKTVITAVYTAPKNVVGQTDKTIRVASDDPARPVLMLRLIADVAPPHPATPASALVVATIAVEKAGRRIPTDFSGLSYEGRQLLPDNRGNHYFSPTNTKLITLFRTLGVKNLRIGGNSSELAEVNPTDADRAALFGFARAAGVRVIFNLRMKPSAGEHPDPSNEPGQVRIADTLLREDTDVLQAFELSNEPDHDSIKTWAVYQPLADQLMADVAKTPDGAKARFVGPSTTSGKAVNTFPAEFAQTYAGRPNVILTTQHWYPGGNQRMVKDVAAKRAELVDAEQMHRRYVAFAAKFVPAVQSAGMKFRLEETNSLSLGGRTDVSDTFASALWALDYLYWWAAHDAVGLNFHSGSMPYSAIGVAADGYETRPVGYALKAFDLGGHGRLVPVTLDQDDADLTAYAVLADDGSIAITLLNSSHDGTAATTTVTLRTGAAAYAHGATWTLQSPNHSIAAKSGLTLGGSAIADDGTWSGAATPLAADAKHDFTVEVTPASAVIVHLY